MADECEPPADVQETGWEREQVPSASRSNDSCRGSVRKKRGRVGGETRAPLAKRSRLRICRVAEKQQRAPSVVKRCRKAGR